MSVTDESARRRKSSSSRRGSKYRLTSHEVVRDAFVTSWTCDVIAALRAAGLIKLRQTSAVVIFNSLITTRQD